MDDAAFVDLPLEAYPFTIRLYDADTAEVYLEVIVEGPGAVSIPPKPQGCREVKCTIEYADGTRDDGGTYE